MSKIETIVNENVCQNGIISLLRMGLLHFFSSTLAKSFSSAFSSPNHTWSSKDWLPVSSLLLCDSFETYKTNLPGLCTPSQRGGVALQRCSRQWLLPQKPLPGATWCSNSMAGRGSPAPETFAPLVVPTQVHHCYPPVQMCGTGEGGGDWEPRAVRATLNKTTVSRIHWGNSFGSGLKL